MPSFISPLTDPPDGDLVVSVTRLEVRSIPTAFAFFRRLRGVQRQTATTPGLVTFGLRAQLWRMTFSTYGVFTDRRALGAFVGSAAHGDAMRALRGRLHHMESRTTTMPSTDLPADWRQITALLPGETPPSSTPSPAEVL